MTGNNEIRTDLGHLPGALLVTHMVQEDSNFTQVGFNLVSEGADSFPFVSVASIGQQIHVTVWNDQHAKAVRIFLNGNELNEH